MNDNAREHMNSAIPAQLFAGSAPPDSPRQPDPLPGPDRIDPQSPPETPAEPYPDEAPLQEPPEIAPVGPDFDQPSPSFPETPLPPD